MAPTRKVYGIKHYNIQSSTTEVRARALRRSPKRVKKRLELVGYRSDPKRSNNLWERVATNWQYKDAFSYFKNQLYISANDALTTKIAKKCHNSKVAGHFGMEKTIEIIMRDFYWKGLTEWINYYVRSCDECQHNKPLRHP